MHSRKSVKRRNSLQLRMGKQLLRRAGQHEGDCGEDKEWKDHAAVVAVPFLRDESGADEIKADQRDGNEDQPAHREPDRDRLGGGTGPPTRSCTEVQGARTIQLPEGELRLGARTGC